MAEVYYYLTKEQANQIIDCGMKLSEWFDKEVDVHNDNNPIKCISALLNPRDDKEKYLDNDYVCIKIEVNPTNCAVADRVLYELSKDPEIIKKYIATIMPIDKYTFGMFRKPECLITSTVLGENIKLLNKNLDSPIIFNNSEELYFNNIMEYLNEGYKDFNDLVLYYFCNALYSKGIAQKYEDVNKGIAVFIIENKSIVLKIPFIEQRGEI